MAPNNQNILLVVKDQAFRYMVKVAVDLSYDYGIITVKSSAEGLKKLIGAGNTIKFIIYEMVPGDFSFMDMVQKISKEHQNTRLLVIVEKLESVKKSDLTQYSFITVLPKALFTKEFSQVFQKLLQNEEMNDDEFKKIDMDSLAYIDGVTSDAYVKMSSGKYVKLVTKGEVLTPNEIQRYKAQDIHHVYIKKEKVQEVLEQMKKQVQFFLAHPGFKFIVRGKEDSLSKRFEQKILRCADDFCIDEAFQQQLTGVITKTVDAINRIPKLEKILQKIGSQSRERNYLPEHMLLLCYITAAWTEHLGWHSKGTKEKLIYASILHDLTLAGTPHLAEIPDMKTFESMKGSFTPKERDLFINHPLESAQLILSSFQQAPPDTEVIVRQHHERPDGKGFPKGIHWGKINPLSALFIVAHDYVHYVMTHEEHDLEAYLEESSTKFTQSTFANILNVLRKISQQGKED